MIILIVFLLAVVGLLGYINHEQGETIRRLQASIEPAEFERPRVEPYRPYIEIDLLGEIYRIPIDSEGRVNETVFPVPSGPARVRNVAREPSLG